MTSATDKSYRITLIGDCWEHRFVLDTEKTDGAAFINTTIPGGAGALREALKAVMPNADIALHSLSAEKKDGHDPNPSDRKGQELEVSLVKWYKNPGNEKYVLRESRTLKQRHAPSRPPCMLTEEDLRSREHTESDTVGTDQTPGTDEILILYQRDDLLVNCQLETSHFKRFKYVFWMPITFGLSENADVKTKRPEGTMSFLEYITQDRCIDLAQKTIVFLRSPRLSDRDNAKRDDFSLESWVGGLYSAFKLNLCKTTPDAENYSTKPTWN